MIDAADQNLSISQQCRLLNINRSTYYYKKRPIKPIDLKLMQLIDKQYLKTPTWGSRSMRNHLRRLGYKVNRKRVHIAKIGDKSQKSRFYEPNPLFSMPLSNGPD